MPQGRDPRIDRMQESFAGTEGELRTQPVRRGQVWVIEGIAVCSDDANGGYVDLFIDDGNRLTALETMTLTVADDWYPFTCLPVTALTDYEVVVQFREFGQGFEAKMNVTGHVREPFTSP